MGNSCCSCCDSVVVSSSASKGRAPVGDDADGRAKKKTTATMTAKKKEDQEKRRQHEQRPCCGSNGNKNNKDSNGTSAALATTNEKKPSTSFTYRKGTCALEYWEPILPLGDGSISCIHLVRRRPNAVEIPYRESADVMRNSCRKRGPCSLEDCTKDPDVKVYALKSIMKDHVQNDRYLDEMRAEIATLQHLDHPNVVRLVEAYERRRHIYLVMEYCSGGDLYGVVETKGEFLDDEPDDVADSGGQRYESYVRDVVRYLLSAVEYLHRHNVVHRDLKLENAVFATPERRPSQLKLIDFGLATRFLSNDYKRMTDKVGTVYTMAPQVLQGVYDYKCDLWSVGVISYVLISGGSQPFWGPVRDMPWPERRKIMIDRIMRCQYKRMKHGAWDTVSSEAKDFVSSLLQLDPKLRPTAQQALEESDWMKKKSPEPAEDTQRQQQQKQRREEDAPIENSPSSPSKGSTRRHRQQRLRTLALDMTARELDLEEIEQLNARVVRRVRKQKLSRDAADNGSGDRITFRNLFDALMETGKFNAEELTQTLSSSEISASEAEKECLDFPEFVVAALTMRGRLETETLAEALAHIQDGELPKDCKDEEVCVDQLRSALKGTAAEAIFDRVTSGSSIIISCHDIISMVETKKWQLMESVHSGSRQAQRHDDVAVTDEDEATSEGECNIEDENNEDEGNFGDGDNLVSAENTCIPGGKESDPCQPPAKFAYDPISKSVRKCC